MAAPTAYSRVMVESPGAGSEPVEALHVPDREGEEGDDGDEEGGVGHDRASGSPRAGSGPAHLSRKLAGSGAGPAARRLRIARRAALRPAGCTAHSPAALPRVAGLRASAGAAWRMLRRAA